MDIGRKIYFALHPRTQGAGTFPLLTYSTLAILDPKSPAEMRAYGFKPWALQYFAASAVLYWADPLRLREGEGLDEIWYSGWNPLFVGPGKIWEEIKSLDPIPAAPDVNPWRYVWD